MAKTLLDGVNELFKRVNNIQGDAAALTTLTDSARQHPIDVAIQVINEGIDEIYTTSHVSLPKEQAESTITLATGTRSYILPTDLDALLFPLRDKTNLTFIWEYEGGYNGLLDLDPQQNFTGLPIWAAISPVDGKLFMDRSPTSAENGRVFTFQYEKDTILSAATDAMPFNDRVFRSMVPVWAQLYNRDMRNSFDGELYKQALGRASRAITEKEPRTSYSPRVC